MENIQTSILPTVIRDIRVNKLKLKQSELADYIGTHEKEISRLENGHVPEWLMKAIKLNRLLAKEKMSIDDLIPHLPDQ